MKNLVLSSTLLLALTACNNAPKGEKAETKDAVGTTTAAATPSVSADNYAADLSKSTLNWEGTEPGDEGHKGTIALKSGSFSVENNVLKGGSFDIDMNSIACEDLEDSTYNALLIRHLRDDDFFAVDRFPTAVCAGRRGRPAASPGGATAARPVPPARRRRAC